MVALVVWCGDVAVVLVAAALVVLVVMVVHL